MESKMANNMEFPIDLEIPLVSPYSDFINDIRCRTNNMLKYQMSTFGITIDRIKRIGDAESSEGKEIFIDTKTNKIIFEVRIIPEELKAVLTYKYESYEQ